MAQPPSTNRRRQRSLSPQPVDGLGEGPSKAHDGRPNDKVAQYVPAVENRHRLRLLVAEAVRYQKEHNSTALHRFVRQRLGFREEARGLTPGLPAELVEILLDDLHLVTVKDGPQQAFLQLIELPLWKVERAL
jgi:hypothetical protein